jgi:hypothetical protein
MAQLFPTNKRSFLLPRLTSNCVHVAVPSSCSSARRLCLPLDCCRSSRAKYTRQRNKRDAEGVASSFMTTARLYYRLYYASVVFNTPRHVRFRSERGLSSRIAENRPSTCVCLPATRAVSKDKARSIPDGHFVLSPAIAQSLACDRPERNRASLRGMRRDVGSQNRGTEGSSGATPE